MWTKYANTSKILNKFNGKVILTTIYENAPLLKELFNAIPTVLNIFEFFPDEIDNEDVVIDDEKRRKLKDYIKSEI